MQPANKGMRNNRMGESFHMNSRRIAGASDPTLTTNDILVRKTIRLTSNVPPSGPRSITIPQVLAVLNLPTQGIEFRFHAISVWSQSFSSNSVEGSDSETLVVTIPGVGTAGAIPGGDGASFADNGTFGKKRPQVHIEPPTLVEQRWINVGATGEPDLLARVNISGDPEAGTAIVVHVKCSLRLLANTN